MNRDLTDDSRPRVIAGFGRSGTTWVQDVLATANSLRAVFEPLHPDVFHEAKNHAHAFRASNDEDVDLYNFIQQYFSGDFHSLWVDYRIRLDLISPHANEGKLWRRYGRSLRRTRNAGKNIIRFRGQRKFENRIVKLVRANMMLSWLKTKFGARIVLLIRHPAAVVLSQMNSPDIWKPHTRIDRYRADHKLLDELNVDTRRLLFGPLNDLEAVTLSWCIENAIAIRQAKEQDICVVHYEHLLERGMLEWRRIMTALELQTVPDSDLISRPSQQTSGEQAMDKKLVSQYASWMTRINPQQTKQIQNILDAAESEIYCVDQALPVALP